MDRDLILQRDDPQVAAAKLWAGAPESISVVLLRFRTNRLLNYSNAPFLLEIWALPENLILEVFCEPIGRHV
jgi:hypothetical protein